MPDYYNVTKTENGRVSYPLHHIANFEPTSTGGHPDKVRPAVRFLCLFIRV